MIMQERLTLELKMGVCGFICLSVSLAHFSIIKSPDADSKLKLLKKAAIKVFFLA